MRITNNMLSQNYLNNLNKNMGNLNKYQTQLSTNRRITKLSDDPVGAISSLAVRSKINNLTQHSRNIDNANSMLTQSETSVMEINDVVKSIYEETVKISNGTYNDSDKKTSMEYIKQLRSHLVQVGNATLGNKYIFGGYNTTTPPFEEVSGKILYNGVDLATAGAAVITGLESQSIEYEIGTGINTKASLTGIDLFGTGDDNLFQLLDGLIGKLGTGGTSTEISAYTGKLQGKQQDILSKATEIGGRKKRLELVSERYDQDKINYETIKSNVEGIDTAEVIMQLKIAEASYNTALEIGSKIIQPSLTDFLN